MKKKENNHKPLILYEKYKRDNHIVLNMEISVPSKYKKFLIGVFGVIGNVIIFGILFTMIILSAVGTITLTHPDLKEIFIQIINVI